MVDKKIKDILTKQLELPISIIKAAEDDEENCILTFVGSDETVDRYGDIVKVDGWDLKNYKSNPVFLWAHNSHEMPIGKAEKVWVEDEKLKFRIKFAVNEYPFAKLAYDMYKGGYLNATSVGFIVKDWKFQDDNFVSLEHELLELSAVPVPANPAALRLGFTDDEIAQLKQYQVEKQKSIVEKQSPQVEEVEEKPQVSEPTATEEPVVKEINEEDKPVNEKQYEELKELYTSLSTQLKEIATQIKEMQSPAQVEEVVEQPTVDEQTDVVETTEEQIEKTVDEEESKTEVPTEEKTVEEPVVEEPTAEQPEVVEQPNDKDEKGFTITIEDIREAIK